MYCYQCGTQLEEGSLFCHNCGAKMPDGNVDKEISDPVVMEQNQQNSALSLKIHQEKTVIDKNDDIELTGSADHMENKFKDYVNDYVRKTTEFESAEALLNSKVPQKFVWICFGIPVLLLLALFVRQPSFEFVLVIPFILFIFVYPIALLLDYIFSFRITGGDHRTDETIDAEELIQFLNRNLSYLSPYFNEWNYIRMVGFGVKGMAVAAVQNALQGIRIGTEFGQRKSCFVEIHINPDRVNPDSGQMVYFFSTAIKSIWPAKYVCMVKTVPILQAAMDYYLKEYRTVEKDLSSISQNLTKEETDNKIRKISEKCPAEKRYGDNIKSYYCEQFDRIARGEKTKFNWAALFFGGYNQLYNGCTKVFCRTYLPLLAVGGVINLITILATVRLNFTLMFIMPSLGGIWGLCYLGLSFLNGFKFNTWFYHDFISNPDKKRSRKGLWLLIVTEIAIMIILQLTGHLVAKHTVDSFDDYYDDFDNVFYDDSIDDADEDLLVRYSEDLASIQGENIEDSMIDTAQYEETAREIIIEWFSRHPLQHNFRIEFMNETANTEDGSGIYLNYEMYWGDDEWYGSFYVNPVNGDMNMDSMIQVNGITTVQESMDQWYLEDYWFLGEDLGGYSELYGDNIYFLYNGYNEDGNPILEYYAENDSYRICDYDGQCLIEYDDGSETSKIDISNFAGTYAYDGSFEADDGEINFYYLLEIGEWDGYSFSIAETWRGNMLIQDEYARAKSLVVDTLTFDIYNPDVGYETHSLTYVPAKESTLGKDVIYLDGDNTMPFVRE